jgi:ornithine cyclodeaminase/alanine dehydrogenase-like protein (mu-crystallin family)
MTLILSNDDIDQLLTMADYVDILEDAYGELAAGRGVVRPRSDSLAPTAMPGAVYGLKSADGIAPKFGAAAVRINSDIITYPEVGGVPRRVKVPAAPNKRWVGLVLLFSTETGEPLAIFPDGAMQRMRVGATSGLGAKYLAREDARTAAIIGSGFQAAAQLMALAAVRDIQQVRCFSPNAENREAFCREWGDHLQIDMTPVASAAEAAKGADVVACSTSSLGHVFFEDMLEPGMHVSSIKLPEIDPKAVNRADLVFIHNLEDKSPTNETADLPDMKKIAGADGAVKKAVGFDTLPTVFDLIADRAQGRTAAEQITCFLNNTGTGYQFAACGAVAYRKAKEMGLGHELPTDWFTEDVHP